MGSTKIKKNIILKYSCGHGVAAKLELSRIELECDFAATIRCPDCIKSRKCIEVDDKLYYVGDSVLYRGKKNDLFKEFTILAIDPNCDILTIVAKNKEIYISVNSPDLKLLR